MKVLTKGTVSKPWSASLTCTGVGNGDQGCGAFLLVEQRDLFLTQGFTCVDHDVCVTFKCCECGTLTDIFSSNQPHCSIVAKLPKTQAAWEEIQSKTGFE